MINQLLGKKVVAFKSSRIYINCYGDRNELIFLDYNSLILLSSDKNNHYSPLYLNGYWMELENRNDDLGLELSLGEDHNTVKNLLAFSHLKSGFSKAYKNGFVIGKIELFGYKQEFNFYKRTQHIVLFHRKDHDDKILIKAEQANLGISITFDSLTIKDFFENSLNSNLIYNSNTYS